MPGRAPQRRAPSPAWRFLGVLGLLLGLAGAHGADAQPVAGQGVAVYRFAEPGQPVIAVDLWGSIRQTGRYFIPPEMGLLDLITLAGGPAAQPETDQVIRETTVELSRADSTSRTIVFTSQLEALTSGEAQPPPLRSGDVVTVRTTLERRFEWTDALSVVAAVASVTLVILRIASIGGNI